MFFPRVQAHRAAHVVLLLTASACVVDTVAIRPPADTGERAPIDPSPPAWDVDGDGWDDRLDCDDRDASVHPGAEEACDGVDENCNGVVDDGFPDRDGDGTPDCVDQERCDGVDNDGDGEIDEGMPDSDGDGLLDCFDVEECDGADNDGDGEIDEDFDQDGDGHLACGPRATDCDDGDPDVNVDAVEVPGNNVDDDCNSLIDDDRWPGRRLLITEIKSNPLLVPDHQGEWIEIFNPGDEDVELAGLTLISGGPSGDEQFTFSATVPGRIAPGAYAVVGLAGPALNGGVQVDGVYGEVRLENESDWIELRAGGLLLDRVAWDDGATFPDAQGTSMQLDIFGLDESLNDLGEWWCKASLPGPGGEPGSPGGPNEFCPSIDRDGDGYSPEEGDCDDADLRIGPGQAEVPYDGADNDCDPLTLEDDLDEDGFGIALDCDDAEADFNPDADEVCDSEDNDCDGLIDDDDTDTVDATYSWPDIDQDGYGGIGSSPVLSCAGATVAGWAENDQDCDDADDAVNPGASEVAYDGFDQDCDGGDRLDADRDGYIAVAAGGDDCDDTNNMVFPYQWEEPSDGIDNDCDGLIDAADTGSPTRLTLSDDSSATITFSSVRPMWCGSARSSAFVISNGRVMFGTSSTSYSESATTMATSSAIGVLWDDLNPSSCGAVWWQEHADAIAVYYRAVCEYGTSADTLTATVVLHESGLLTLSYPRVTNITDGLVGWSCGSGVSNASWDLSAATFTDPALGIGEGTENLVYELWTAGNDISGETLTFCMSLDTDADGDGWTPDCGDTDDGDATVYPGG
jgi:hypothetical protein